VINDVIKIFAVMMGMVFEEFFAYVERECSADMVDDIIIDA
jgi:hypothetical protein